MKISEITPTSLTEAYYSNYDKWQQAAMDRSKRDFKRSEMEHELRHEDEAEWKKAYRPAYKKPQAPEASGVYYITINGKIWKKDGAPVQFNGIGHANAVASKIKAKDSSKDIRVTSTASESENLDESHYDSAEKILADAKIAKENGDMADYYTLMADYHDHLVQWHESKGRHVAADRDAAKVEQYHAAAQALIAKSDFE
jgi:hypothetical protein